MKCFITGANGFIGRRLVQRLSEDGHIVRCLVRSDDKFNSLAHFSGVTSVIGDLENYSSLKAGAKGCDVIFHLAALAKPWTKDKSLPFRVNVKGTKNILKASLSEGVRRFVFTSSAAVIGPSPGENAVDESYIRTAPFFNEYEKTKNTAEHLVTEYSKAGIDTIIVNPSRVFGPGPAGKSNSVTKIIDLYNRGRWYFIPGDGRCTGNYVFIDDVVDGHIMAAIRGKSGERYILGGENLTFDRFFEILAELSGKQRRLIHLPLHLMTTVASVMELQARVTNIPPLLTAPWVKKYMNHWSISSNKAAIELGYRITPFKTGVELTLDWLKNQARV